jgi:RNA polymerase sigma-70 factor (ECF subfamily)
MPNTVNNPQRVFLTTCWTEVLQAAQASAPGGAAALENLCCKYWYPLYAYVRREGFSPHDAQDLTQSFFARFLEKNYLAQVDPARGKFRSFLLASLKHFLANEWDRLRAQKRGGGAQIISLDEQSAEARYLLEPRDEINAEKIFERRWALTILEEVLGRLERECADAGKADQFRALKDHMMADSAAPQAELARRLNMTPAAVKVAIHRLRKRYRALLREEIAQTVSAPDEVDAELRHLLTVIAS